MLGFDTLGMRTGWLCVAANAAMLAKVTRMVNYATDLRDCFIVEFEMANLDVDRKL